jgi:hypothetical protein
MLIKQSSKNRKFKISSGEYEYIFSHSLSDVRSYVYRYRVIYNRELSEQLIINSESCNHHTRYDHTLGGYFTPNLFSTVISPIGSPW